jgi:hypothetical protein
LVRSDAAVSESSSRHENFERLVGSGTNISQASLKRVKESGLSLSDTRILASEVTKITSEKSVCDSIRSDKCFKKLTTSDEPFHHADSKQTMRKKHKCHRLNDNLLTCLKASALLNDPKLKMCAVVKLKKGELNKKSEKAAYSTSHSPIRKDISTSDNLPRAPKKSKPRLLESSSMNEMFFSKSNPHNSVAELSKDFIQPQLSSRLFINADQFSKKKSVKNVVQRSSKLKSVTVEKEPQFFLPHLHVHLSSQPALSNDSGVSMEKECAEVLSDQQNKGAAERQVVSKSHQSPLLVKEQDIENLTKHQHAVWSWSKNIPKQCRKEITTVCNGLDALSDHISCNEEARVKTADKVLKQLPVDEGANVVNCDSDEKALYQFMKVLNVPKRTVTTQVDLVENILEGSESVAVENETDNRYVDLVSAIQRVILRLQRSGSLA